MSFEFTEAARLYAQYRPVIDAMQSEFQKSVAAFLDSVHRELKAQLPRLQQKSTPDARYWWLSESDTDQEFRPQLWALASAVEIVHPGKLKLLAIFPKGGAREQLTVFHEIARRTDFRGFCQPAAGGPWSMFNVEIAYGEDEPVRVVTERVAQTLVALDSAYEGLAANRAGIGS